MIWSLLNLCLEDCEYIRKSLFLGEVKHRFWKDPRKKKKKKSYATLVGRMWNKLDDLLVYLEYGSTTDISSFHQCQVRNWAQDLS